jgi:hypothetical protein
MVAIRAVAREVPVLKPADALGQKQTLERVHRMSALPPKADIKRL